MSSSDKRQRTVTTFEMDMTQQLDQLRNYGAQRQELGLLHAPYSHSYLHTMQELQEILRTGEYRVNFVELFDPSTSEIKKYFVLINPDGRIRCNRDIALFGVPEGTPLDTIIESIFFKTEISSLSYLESNSILRHLPAIEIIVALTLRIAAETAAQKDSKNDWKSRIPEKMQKLMGKLVETEKKHLDEAKAKISTVKKKDLPKDKFDNLNRKVNKKKKKVVKKK